MALDLRGSLKNTRINPSIYVVFEEMFSNAVDSYLIRKHREPESPPLSVAFSIASISRDLLGEVLDLKITCCDNGAGLGDAETKAFVTKDTSFKDDLAIPGIGECKGSGRIQYFHYFSELYIRSIYKHDDQYFSRSIRVDGSTREIDEDSFITEQTTSRDPGTSVTLSGIKPDVHGKLFATRNLRQDYSAQEIKRHILVTFLHRLVSLKQHVGNFTILVETNWGETVEKEVIGQRDLPEVTSVESVTVRGKRFDEEVGTQAEFSLSHYALSQSDFDLRRNVVALCARFSPVQAITRRYLKTGSLENNPINGFYHLILVESSYLDRCVNEQRDGFTIPERSDPEPTLFNEQISFEEIFDAVDPEISAMLAPPDWDRDEVVASVEQRYGISTAIIAEVNVRVRQGDTDETVATRVIKALGERAVQETSELFSLKEEIAKISPDSEDFRTKVNELAWKFTASLKTINMANLSQLVVRRAAIIETLGLAIRNQLTVQQEDGRKKDERIIHSLFFPMGKDSKETCDHDVWLLSEEYHYFDYIASDKPLASIRWEGDQLLFESDVDKQLQSIFDQRNIDNKGKRPDIALFCKEGAVVIVEFKAPGVSLEDHANDLMEYSQLLAAKSNGRLKRFYGYLIGDTLNPLRLRGYKRFPNGSGYFSTDPIVEPDTQASLGELYSEILFYEDIERKAKLRLEVYRQRLDLHIS